MHEMMYETDYTKQLDSKENINKKNDIKAK
jgi:hypothetical protein